MLLESKLLKKIENIEIKTSLEVHLFEPKNSLAQAN
jgi:hypothetical protein